MRAMLEFELPEDKDGFTLATKGSDFWSCLWELNNELRTFVKHGHDFKDAEEVIEWVRDFIYENVDLECVS